MADTQLLKRADAHLDKVSDALRMLRGQRFNNQDESFTLIEDALFNALLALRILVRGETDG